jgi:hypoxanthine-DNA glycosylase
MSSDSTLLDGLPPILDAGVETLILGSFPSPASLSAQQYYAHRQNQFWRLLAALLNEPLADLDYAGKQCCLLRHRIGVWDVFHRCRREGALDSAIQSAEPNDFSRLSTEVPRLRRICFNGKTSARFERCFAQQGYDSFVLPSSSPAFTLAFERKVECWREAWLSTPAPS